MRVITLTFVLITVLVSGCGQPSFIPPAYMPPEYYTCTEIDPKALVNVYYTSYADFTTIERLYNNVIFVFKNVPVDQRMVMALDEGYIWVDQVKCYLATPESMKRFQPGDKIDVVGRNDGPIYYQMGLTFKEVYVLPAGEIPFDQGDVTPAILPGY